MKELPILFSTAMIQAILAGNKTQTRRIVKPQPFLNKQYSSEDPKYKEWFSMNGSHNDLPEKWIQFSPYGKIGDILWVRHLANIFSVYYFPIKGFEGKYYAGTDGNIYNSCQEQLVGAPTSKGYLCVSLSNGTKKTHLIHRLIAETFYSNHHRNHDQVRHMDSNRINNLPSNLDWGSQSDNWTDRQYLKNGIGHKHHASKLSEQDVSDIKQSTVPQSILAEKYNVSKHAIHAIKNGKTYKDYPTPSRNYKEFKLWRSPIFMPREACRIRLKITDIGVERLQDISEGDAIAEGIKAFTKDEKLFKYGIEGWEWSTMPRSAIEAYQRLWESINGRDSWNLNLWVWKISFVKL
jgi:hypothetical protein